MDPDSHATALEVEALRAWESHISVESHSFQVWARACLSVRSTGLKRILKRVARRIVVRVSTVGRATASLNISRGLRILTYHRVAEDLADPFCVAPAAFASQMEFLATTGAVVELGMALAGLVEGTGS